MIQVRLSAFMSWNSQVVFVPPIISPILDAFIQTNYVFDRQLLMQLKGVVEVSLHFDVFALKFVISHLKIKYHLHTCNFFNVLGRYLSQMLGFD
jgi:hypothetical protein